MATAAPSISFQLPKTLINTPPLAPKQSQLQIPVLERGKKTKERKQTQEPFPIFLFVSGNRKRSERCLVGVGFMATAAAPDYSDEKWKLSKKEGRGGAASSSSSFVRSCSTSSTAFMRSCSSASPTFTRSSSTASSATGGNRSSFSRKCASLAKEQRAKFYIVRRCVTMLVCWKDYRDS